MKPWRLDMKSLMPLLVIVSALALGGCGQTRGERALTGGALGAGAGAGVAAIAGGSLLTGAVVGGLGGAAVGALTGPKR
jgi:osmotically inducible lipoprotein OsmB